MDANLTHRAQLFGVFALLLGFSIWSPTGKLDEFPKYWWDESFTIETARTFNELGVFDMTVEPNTPSDLAIVLNSNGFPLALPLALVFRVTGVSVTVARIMMCLWILLLFVALYRLLKRHITRDHALQGLVLIASFAPFYANGRTATGDIPGLFFFVLALTALTDKKFFWTGIFTGLALVTKTSSYHVAPFAVAIGILATHSWKNFRPIGTYIIGGLSVAMLWLWLLLPTLRWESLQPGFAFFAYPTHKASFISQVMHDPSLLLNQALALVVGLVIFYLITFRKTQFLQSGVSITLLAYGTLQTISFLRTAGWNRYLLPVEILLLLLLPVALSFFVKRYTLLHTQEHAARYALILIASVFSLHYQFASDIFKSNSRDETARAVMQLLASHPNSTVGFLNDPITAALIPGDKKYQYLRLGGNTYAGNSSYFNNENALPTFFNAIPESLPQDAFVIALKRPDLTLWQQK